MPELPTILPPGQGKLILVMLVRDVNGLPKFADPNNVPKAVLDILSDADLEYLETLKT